MSDNLPIVISDGSTPEVKLDAVDLTGAAFGGYSAVFTNLLKHPDIAINVKALSVRGIQYGAAALVSDIPGGLGSLVGVIQAASAFHDGDNLGVMKASLGTLGGITVAEFAGGAALLIGVSGPIGVGIVTVGAIAAGTYIGYQVATGLWNVGFGPAVKTINDISDAVGSFFTITVDSGIIKNITYNNINGSHGVASNDGHGNTQVTQTYSDNSTLNASTSNDGSNTMTLTDGSAREITLRTNSDKSVHSEYNNKDGSYGTADKSADGSFNSFDHFSNGTEKRSYNNTDPAANLVHGGSIDDGQGNRTEINFNSDGTNDLTWSKSDGTYGGDHAYANGNLYQWHFDNGTTYWTSTSNFSTATGYDNNSSHHIEVQNKDGSYHISTTNDDGTFSNSDKSWDGSISSSDLLLNGSSHTFYSDKYGSSSTSNNADGSNYSSYSDINGNSSSNGNNSDGSHFSNYTTAQGAHGHSEYYVDGSSYVDDTSSTGYSYIKNTYTDHSSYKTFTNSDGSSGYETNDGVGNNDWYLNNNDSSTVHTWSKNDGSSGITEVKADETKYEHRTDSEHNVYDDIYMPNGDYEKKETLPDKTVIRENYDAASGDDATITLDSEHNLFVHSYFGNGDTYDQYIALDGSGYVHSTRENGDYRDDITDNKNVTTRTYRETITADSGKSLSTSITTGTVKYDSIGPISSSVDIHVHFESKNDQPPPDIFEHVDIARINADDYSVSTTIIGSSEPPTTYINHYLH